MTSATRARRTVAAVLDRSALALRIAAALLLLTCSARAAEIEPVGDFGANPGHLLMYRYVPDDLPTGMPLVVALHGCTQDARSFGQQSGWIDLADRVGFALLLPEQPASNNRDRCFTFFSEEHNRRGAGEAASIAAMIEEAFRMEGLGLDRSKAFITGLSAGGSMAVAMLAAYPELFAGGAIVAGVPYGCASTASGPWLKMQRWWFLMSNPFGEAGWASWRCGIARYGFVNAGAATASADEWRDRLEEAGGDIDAAKPIVTLWQGNADRTVDPANLGELIKQWTALHGIDAAADGEESAGSLRVRSYADSSGKVLVESVEVEGLGHAQPVDPGPGTRQCGAVGPHMEDLDICAGQRIAEFWGIAVR
jgi:poly(3-hydroxybutyrate) depolymerase